jgi:hypothetical protein
MAKYTPSSKPILTEDMKDKLFETATEDKQELKENIIINVSAIEIEYEATIATAQYENVKPKIKLKLNGGINDIETGLKICREALRAEYKKIKGENYGN